MGVDRERSGRRHEHRVAVGGRLHHQIHADVAVGAGTILDHEGLAEGFAEILGESAREKIDRTSRRAGGDDANRVARPGLREPGKRQGSGGERQCPERALHRRDYRAVRASTSSRRGPGRRSRSRADHCASRRCHSTPSPMIARPTSESANGKIRLSLNTL